MDTSVGHDLDMIRKAVEIQELWERKYQDCFLWQRVYGFRCLTIVFCFNSKLIFTTSTSYSLESAPLWELKNEELIWLPRQDQLQKMVNNVYDLPGLIAAFNYFCHNIYDVELRSKQRAYKYFVTIEQLWLAFVMKEIFNKTWNGRDWIKQ